MIYDNIQSRDTFGNPYMPHNKGITIRLSYDGMEKILPVNPEELTIQRASEGETVDILGIGEIGIPKSPSLAIINIESFTWADRMSENPKNWADWFKTWQRSKKSARFTVEELGYNLNVTCDAFNYTVKAGEETDVYYELSLKEYRPYGATLVTVVKNTKALPTQTQRTQNKPKTPPEYAVKSGDTLFIITKKLIGDGNKWRTLYDIKENKKVIGSNPNLIKVGQKLIVPQSWYK